MDFHTKPSISQCNSPTYCSGPGTALLHFTMLSNLSSRAGELRAHNTAQAARDPNSTTTAHDAEQVMAEESKKAGIAAFQFDPDASPEDKAAQARSVS